MGMKGFYMSIDISIAAGLAIIILLLILVAFSNMARSDMSSVAFQRGAESALYSMKNDGTLNNVFVHMEANNRTYARGLLIERFSQYGVTNNYRIGIRMFDSSMVSVQNLTASSGVLKTKSYSSTLPISYQGNQTYFFIVSLEEGV